MWYLIFFAVLNLIIQSAYSIKSCDKSEENTVCFKDEKYAATINPEPLPTLINVTVNVNDIIDVNEEDQTVTLILKLILEWYDERIKVDRSQQYIER